jgi:hypothetical protein
VLNEEKENWGKGGEEGTAELETEKKSRWRDREWKESTSRYITVHRKAGQGRGRLEASKRKGGGFRWDQRLHHAHHLVA